MEFFVNEEGETAELITFYTTNGQPEEVEIGRTLSYAQITAGEPESVVIPFGAGPVKIRDGFYGQLVDESEHPSGRYPLGGES